MRRPYRVLFVNTAFAPDLLGGAERSALELVNGLREAGCDVQVVCLTDSATASRLEPGGVLRVSSRAFNVFVDGRPRRRIEKLARSVSELCRLKAYVALRRAIRKFNPDIVHFNNISGFGWLGWRAARDVPAVQTYRDYSCVCNSATGMHDGTLCNRTHIVCRLTKTVFSRTRFRPSIAVGVSQHIANRMASAGLGGIDGIAHVVYNAPMVDAAVVRRPVKGSFGYVGRIAADKGIEIVIEAFARAELPASSSLLIAGKGNPQYIAEIRNRFSTLINSGQLSFVGHVVPTEFFSRVDVAIVSTQWEEPFGRVAAEALAVGVPLVYSAVGGLPEVVSLYGGKTISVEDFTSPDAWAVALRKSVNREWSHIRPDRVPLASPEAEYLKLYHQARPASPR